MAILLVAGVVTLICFMAFRRRRTPRDGERRAGVHPYTHYYAGAPYTHGSMGGGGGSGGGAGGSF